jgi:hypothetical protein
MLERMPRWLTIVVMAGFAFSGGCAHFTKSGRQQLAYQKYVRKQSGMRARQQVKMKTPRVPRMPASEPKETTTVSDSPQSVTSAEAGTGE